MRTKRPLCPGRNVCPTTVFLCVSSKYKALPRMYLCRRGCFCGGPTKTNYVRTTTTKARSLEEIAITATTVLLLLWRRDDDKIQIPDNGSFQTELSGIRQTQKEDRDREREWEPRDTERDPLPLLP